MSASLKPAAIARNDYGIAQRPHFGGELEIWATTAPGGVIKAVKNLDGVNFETKTYLSSGFDNCIRAVVVGQQGLHGAITGIIEVPDWTYNKSANFQSGWGGVGSIPASFGARGDELLEVDIPGYDPALTGSEALYYEIGSTTDKSLKLPVRVGKPISSGMNSSRWTPPGKTAIGNFSLSAKNSGPGEGLWRIAGFQSTVMIKVVHEAILEVARIFIVGWTPEIDDKEGAEDTEAEITASGPCQAIVTFLADGTAAS